MISRAKSVQDTNNLASTNPIANVTCERGFSCLKRLKTYLRSTMGQERLSELAILNLESEMISLIDIEAVVNEFCFT